MKQLLFAAAVLAVTAAPAQACPDYTAPAYYNYSYPAAQLRRQPITFYHIAGGEHRLVECGMNVGGYVAREPDFQFTIQGAETGYSVRFRVQAVCDTILLVRTPNGEFRYDDNSGGYLNAQLELIGRQRVGGPIYVWIGTADGSGCAADLEIMTDS